jgi:lactate racemase
VKPLKNSIDLLTSAWYGDRTLTVGFPAEWDIQLVEQADQPALTDSALREKMKNPEGAPPLSELVKGKKKVAVLVDDTQRPTPLKRIIPLVMEELREGGIDQDAISIFMATACHRVATQEDFIKKLGADTVKTYKTLSHDCTRNLTYLGKTSGGTPIYVNRFVIACDVKIGIGGVYPNEGAGFGGGSKIIHPGICGKETAQYLHHHIRGIPRGSTRDSEFRADMEEIAEKTGLDFTISVLLNRNRDIGHIFCGHRIIAHQEAVKVAKQCYAVKPSGGADIIIANAYPFDTSLHFLSKGLWPFTYAAKKSSKVVIASCPEGLGYHALSLASMTGWSGFFHRMRAFSRHDVRRYLTKWRNKEPGILLFSSNIKKRELKKIYPQAALFTEWGNLISELKSRHPEPYIRVAVYPCSPLQVPLDSA